VLAVIYVFDFETTKHLFPVMCLAGAGFVIHAFLPRRFQLGFFALLSLVAILFVLGWRNGGWVIGLGASLIALVQLPLPRILRGLLLAVAVVQLAAGRAGYPAPFWPVLGSLFMFRLMIYLYDLRHERHWPPLGQTVSYFFMLPNVCFPFFPVVDFKTFRETYFDKDDYQVYQEGVAWMVRGLTHLLAYRIVKYFVLPPVHELTDLPHLVLFLAANYALYLRVSGHFHLIVGILHLFGFHLPRTHDYYFLASSCTDIWRRINIYWKDYMTKVFFWPAFYQLRGWGRRTALVAATFWVFLATWFLHSYQLFWLVGDLSFSPKVAYLWLGAGLVVAVNLLLDQAWAARNPTGPKGWSALRAALRSLQVAGMFGLISIFWACWTAPQIIPTLYTGRWREGNWEQPAQFLALLLMAIVVVGISLQFLHYRLFGSGDRSKSLPFLSSAALQTGTLAALLVSATPWAMELAGPTGGQMIASLKLDSFTPLESVQTVRGYYEEVTDTPVQAGPMLGTLSGKEQTPDGDHYLNMTRSTDDLLERELIPGWSGQLQGARITVNRQGMRDKNGIALLKPPDICRIALVGSSVVMGYGVEDDQVFKVLLEDHLNQQRQPGLPRYELLNFGAGLNFAIHRRVLIDRKVLAYQPDAIYYFAHQDEWLGPVRHLAKLVAHRVDLPYPCLQEVVERAGITPETSWGLTQARLQSYAPDILSCIYRDLVTVCRQHSILPVWIYLPMPGVVDTSVHSADLIQLAADCGFEVIDLSNWWGDHRPEEVKLSATDHHANALGHRLIAERLEEVLARRPELLTAGKPNP
jgi:hypothetical protein